MGKVGRPPPDWARNFSRCGPDYYYTTRELAELLEAPNPTAVQRILKKHGPEPIKRPVPDKPHMYYFTFKGSDLINLADKIFN